MQIIVIQRPVDQICQFIIMLLSAKSMDRNHKIPSKSKPLYFCNMVKTYLWNQGHNNL